MKNHHHAALAIALAVVPAVGAASAVHRLPPPQADAARRGVWIDRDVLMGLPTSGPAWEALERLVLDEQGNARLASVELELANQDDDGDRTLLATAFYAVRTGREDLQELARSKVDSAMGSEDGGRTLALGRNLQGLVVAADVLEHHPAAFCSWLDGVLREDLQGRTIISTHEERPNNWGTHAGAARLLADWFLHKWGTPEQRQRATRDGVRAVAVWRGWLGERQAYSDASDPGFEFGELYWQADEDFPVGVNPAGAARDGHSIDGVLPDDQRRAGPFQWPAPRENYAYEALQGATVAVATMARCRYPGPAALAWGDSALLRAWQWLNGPHFAPDGEDGHTDFPAAGDDEWTAHVVNRLYGIEFAAPIPASWGKGMGGADWTHAP